MSEPDSKLGLVTADESIALLKKKPKDFDPKSAAFWKDGEPVPFLFLAKALDAIDKESGRIAITDIVCNLLRTVIQTTPKDLVAVVYLLANKIAPAHEGVELGIGDASIIKALAEACGAKESQIKSKYQVLCLSLIVLWLHFGFSHLCRRMRLAHVVSRSKQGIDY